MNQKPFAGEYVIRDPAKPLDFVPVSELVTPLSDVIEQLRKKYLERVELKPIQAQGEQIQLNLSVYLDRNGKRYIVVLKTAEPPGTIDELVSFINEARVNLNLVRDLEFSSESYHSASRALESMLQEVLVRS